MTGRVGKADQALAVPATPASAVDGPSGFDPSREEITRLRKALEAVRDGDIPRPLGRSWYPNKRESKNDKCIHDEWMYADCGNCISEFVHTVLAQGMSAFGQDPQGLEAKPASPVGNADAPKHSPSSTPDKPEDER